MTHVISVIKLWSSYAFDYDSCHNVFLFNQRNIIFFSAHWCISHRCIFNDLSAFYFVDQCLRSQTSFKRLEFSVYQYESTIFWERKWLISEIRRKHIVKSFSEFNNLFFSSFFDSNKILIDLSVNFDFDDQIRFFESVNLNNAQTTYRTSFDLEKILKRLLRKSFSREICLEKNKYVSDNSIQLIITLFLNSFMKNYFKRRYVKIIQRNIEDNRRSHDLFINSQRDLDNNSRIIANVFFFFFFFVVFIKLQFFYFEWQQRYLVFWHLILSENTRILSENTRTLSENTRISRDDDANARKKWSRNNFDFVLDRTKTLTSLRTLTDLRALTDLKTMISLISSLINNNDTTATDLSWIDDDVEKSL